MATASCASATNFSVPPSTATASTVTVHEIAGGQAVAEFAGPIHNVDADEIDPNAILDLLEHVSLGHTSSEREAELARHRARRFITVAGSASER